MSDSTDPLQKKIDAIRTKIVRLATAKNQNDPDVRADTNAAYCSLFSLLTLQAQMAGLHDAAKEYSRQHCEYEKRASASEANRKNRLMPLILEELDKWQRGASQIAELANRPVFDEADEVL